MPNREMIAMLDAMLELCSLVLFIGGICALVANNYELATCVVLMALYLKTPVQND